MPETLTESDLIHLFMVTSEEWAWARGVARKGPSMVALLTHLKVFQHATRFLSVADLPSSATSHIAEKVYMEAPTNLGYDRRMLYRHHHAIRQYLCRHQLFVSNPSAIDVQTNVAASCGSENSWACA
jgi:hypothetical protein